jgi:hypothetical protein
MLSNVLGWKSWYGLCTKRAIMRLGTSTLALIKQFKRASGTSIQRAPGAAVQSAYGTAFFPSVGAATPHVFGATERAASR